MAAQIAMVQTTKIANALCVEIAFQCGLHASIVVAKNTSVTMIAMKN